LEKPPGPPAAGGRTAIADIADRHIVKMRSIINQHEKVRLAALWPSEVRSMWMTIWTVTIAMALGFAVLATLLKDGATFRN
jgi:hypothetical protein